MQLALALLWTELLLDGFSSLAVQPHGDRFKPFFVTLAEHNELMTISNGSPTLFLNHTVWTTT